MFRLSQKREWCLVYRPMWNPCASRLQFMHCRSASDGLFPNRTLRPVQECPQRQRHRKTVFLPANNAFSCLSVRHFSYMDVVTAIATSPPVLFTQDTLQLCHSATNLPWWAVIVLSTVSVRGLVTLPIMVLQQKNIAKYVNLQPEIKLLAEELKRELQKQIQNLIVRDNCHPMKSFILMWVQVPIWVSISFALRNILYMMPNHDLASQLEFLSMTTGGFLWIPNLTVPDASFILPVFLGLVNLTIVEIHALRTLKTTRFQKILTNAFRAFTVMMMAISTTVPSCLSLYWMTSSTVALIQNLLLMSPSFRKNCGIPLTKTDSETPYHDLLKQIKTKFGSLNLKSKT